MDQVVYYFALFIGIIPFSILLWKRRAFDHKEAVVPFVWITAIASLYEFFITELLYVNSTYWFQFYSFLEIICLFYYFYKIFKKSHKRLLIIMLGVLLFFFIVSCCFWTNKSHSLPLAINAANISLFVFLFSVLHFNILTKTKSALLGQPHFLFTVGFSIYYSSTLLLFLLYEQLSRIHQNTEAYWMINIVANLILRTFLIIGTWKMKAN